jgi:hypothetical protein
VTIRVWQSWVTVTTALLSNLAAYNAHAPMEQRVQVRFQVLVQSLVRVKVVLLLSPEDAYDTVHLQKLSTLPHQNDLILFVGTVESTANFVAILKSLQA